MAFPLEAVRSPTELEVKPDSYYRSQKIRESGIDRMAGNWGVKGVIEREPQSLHMNFF